MFEMCFPNCCLMVNFTVMYFMLHQFDFFLIYIEIINSFGKDYHNGIKPIETTNTNIKFPNLVKFCGFHFYKLSYIESGGITITTIH